ncbi:hypothetical protein [Actinophytocola sp. NPDC049390]|uniref:hypothetical protein n=1 Tax=Actinophytocola sp. NPDC049390 TaxID=3363894 RepID=UPI0037B737A0
MLDGAGALSSAAGPREVEQITAELIGAELFRVLEAGEDGLRFSVWFEELVGAAQAVDAEYGSRLLYGLAAIASPEQAEVCRKALQGIADAPEGLDDLLHISATGEVLRMRDAYGTRFGVIAGFSYGDTPFVYLFDIEGAEAVRLASAGVFDDVDQAVDAWAAEVGESADGVTPRPVGGPEDLLCLTDLAIGDFHVFGDESRVVMDNWFRAQRHIRDLAELLPPPAPLFDFDATPMIAAFTAWYEDRRGAEPDPDAVASLAEQWMEAALPETWYSVSPLRIRTQRALIGDWLPGDPVTLAAQDLLPDLAAWLAERAKLPDHLREQVVAATK